MRIRKPPHTWGPYHIGNTGDLFRSGPILEEPPHADTLKWTAATCRRLLVAGSGPVVVGTNLPPSHLLRYERAQFPIVSVEAELADVAREYWHNLPAITRLAIGWGSPLPQLVIVGDRSLYADQPPFASKTGHTVFSAAREMGYDELSLYVANARGRRRERRDEQLCKLYAQFFLTKPRWVAIGERAGNVLTRNNLPHIKLSAPPMALSAPSKIRIEAMVHQMKQKGLPTGPWLNEELPTVPCEHITKMDYPLCIDTVAISGTNEQRELTNKRLSRSCDPTTSEKIRRLYVTGQARSIKKAAEQVGYKSHGIHEVARAQGWNQERDDHQRMKTERYLKADADAEIKVARSLREKSFRAAKLAMQNVLEQFEDPDFTCTPGQAKQLADTAISLANANVGESSEEHDALSGMSLQQLAEDATNALKRFTQSTN